MSNRREIIDILDWTAVFGAVALLPCAYFWGCGLAHEVFGYWCRGDTLLLLLGLVVAIPLSGIAGLYGSRWWWSVTAIAIGTLLFFGLRLH